MLKSDRHNFYFTNRTIVISGAASGIGKQLALDFAAGDTRLVLMDINGKGLADVAAACTAMGAKVHSAICNVAQLDQVKTFERQLPEQFRSVDLLICNAGVTAFTDVEKFCTTQNAHIFGVNYFGTVNMVATFLPAMAKRRQGHIVGISSAAGIRGIAQTACYGASKAAQAIFLEGLRIDLRAQNIAVTTILSGFVDTPMNKFLHEQFALPFVIPVSTATAHIRKAISNRKANYIFPFSTWISIQIGKFIPDFIYDFIIANHPFKRSQPQVKSQSV